MTLETITRDDLSTTSTVETIPVASFNYNFVDTQYSIGDARRTRLMLQSDGQRGGVLETRHNADGSVLSTTAIDYTYDAENRLTVEQRDEGNDGVVNGHDYTATFTLDLAGNRWRKLQTGNQPADITYLYNDRDQLTNEGPDADSDGIPDASTALTYEYDLNGSTTAKRLNNVLQATYSWDLRNRMVAVDGNDPSDTAYTYDSNGVRVAKIGDTESTFYLIDPANPTGYAKAIEESTTQGGAPTRSYVLGLDIVAQADAASTPAYFLKDGHGSTRALLDDGGVIISNQSFDYDAFGALIGYTGAPATDWLAPDGRQDTESGFTYSLARYRQDSRFISYDSFEADPASPASLHKYLYANANPINMVDPSGQSAFGVIEQLIVTGGQKLFTAIKAAPGIAARILVRAMFPVTSPVVWGPAAQAALKLGLAGPAIAAWALKAFAFSMALRAAIGTAKGIWWKEWVLDYYLPPAIRETQALASAIAPISRRASANLDNFADTAETYYEDQASYFAVGKSAAQAELGLIVNGGLFAAQAQAFYSYTVQFSGVMTSALGEIGAEIHFEPDHTKLIKAILSHDFGLAEQIRNARLAIEDFRGGRLGSAKDRVLQVVRFLRSYAESIDVTLAGSLHV